MPFALEVFAVHRLEIDDSGAKQVVPVGGALGTQLPADARERLEAYAENLHGRDEATDANAVSAWFNPGAPSEIADLLRCEATDFDARTRAAMTQLRDRTPASTRSAGLVLFLRGSALGRPTVGIFKLALTNVEHTRFDRTAGSAELAIAVERIADVLPPPGETKKAALIPTPAASDLRVLDVQLGGDPAGYWLAFLGARARPPEKQMARAAANIAADVLERDFGLADAWSPVIEKLPSGVSLSVSPRDFFDEIADHSGVSRGQMWECAVARDPGLQGEHVVVPGGPDNARRLVVKLGGGVALAGPARNLGEQMEIDRDDDGWYVKVRPADPERRPNPRLA